MSRLLLIRADADSTFGFGHVMRTLALAQYWRDTFGPIVYLCRQLPDQLVDRLKNERIELRWLLEAGLYDSGTFKDAKHTLDVILELGPASVVFDGYRFKPDYQDAIRDGLALIKTNPHTNRPRTLLLDDDGRFDRYPR